MRETSARFVYFRILLTVTLVVLGLLTSAPALLADPLSTGACCFPDGHCVVLILDECQAQSGVWMGPDTSCDPNPCGCLLPCWSGACCMPDGQCRWIVQEQCLVLQGAWMGPNTTCQPNPCIPASAPDYPTVMRTWGWVKSIYR